MIITEYYSEWKLKTQQRNPYICELMPRNLHPLFNMNKIWPSPENGFSSSFGNDLPQVLAGVYGSYSFEFQVGYWCHHSDLQGRRCWAVGAAHPWE